MSQREAGEDQVRDEDLADVPQMGERTEPQRVSARAKVGRFLGPALGLLAYLVIPSGAGGLGGSGRATVAVAVIMAVWWVTEALPIAATALLPIVLFPLTGVLGIEDATAPYANELIFLFMGGFMIALAMQRWGLHRRIALVTVRAVGTSPVRIVGGFMLATAFLSMWVSNTATTVMMLPIGVSVLQLVFDRLDKQDVSQEDVTGRGAPRFATCLMLAIAYAASIGSLATIIGTPPNTFAVAFLQQEAGVSIGFGQWMLFGVPLAAVFLVIGWVLLTRVLYPPDIDEVPGGREMIQSELEELGPVSRGEKVVGTVFAVTALLWIFRTLIADSSLIASFWPSIRFLDDSSIAIAAALALFLIPVDRRHGAFALDWKTAVQLPWGVLLLFGGGLSLAAAVTETGVDVYIGEQVNALGGLPTVLLVTLVVTIVIFLTEFTSNTATTAAVVPIMAGVAGGLGYGPVVLVVPAALAATCAFMLPVATPPNAIVFGSGHVTIPQMVRAGVWLNLVGIVLVTLCMYALGFAVLGVDLS